MIHASATEAASTMPSVMGVTRLGGRSKPCAEHLHDDSGVGKLPLLCQEAEQMVHRHRVADAQKVRLRLAAVAHKIDDAVVDYW